MAGNYDERPSDTAVEIRETPVHGVNVRQFHQNPVLLTWEDVNYSISLDKRLVPYPRRESTIPKRQLLAKMSGVARPGQLLAIMGSSGAGKTTLLNVLAGRLTLKSGDELNGKILVSGRRRGPSWRRVAGYVEQDDLLYGNLTVTETIEFAANMKLPKDLSHGQKRAFVDKVIDLLGLGNVRHSRIGDEMHRGVSGGERKRVAIAEQLITFPGLLFLDEPTTGLDSTTALSLIETLKNIATLTNMTIILTIHQPRAAILPLFDQLLLMTRGRTVYCGQISACLDYFRKEFGLECPQLENPADFLMDAITVKPDDLGSLERIKAMHLAWEQQDPLNVSEELTAYGLTINNNNNNDDDDHHASSTGTKLTWPNNRMQEFWYLFDRNNTLFYRSRTRIIASLAQTLIICLLLSFTFFQLPSTFAGVQGLIGILFFVAVNVFFTTVNPLLPVFAVDRAIMLRERNGASYRVLPGYLARWLSLLPFEFFQMLLFALPLYFIVGLRLPVNYLLVFLAVLLALKYAALCFGFFIASICPTLQLSQILGPLLIVIFLIYGGNLANSGQVTWILRWIQYISIIFYTYQALAQNEFEGNYYGTTIPTDPQVPGSFYLQLYGLNKVSIWGSFGCLLGLGTAFLFLGYFGLRITTRPKITLI